MPTTTRKKNIEVHVTFLPVAPGSNYDPCIVNPVNMIDRFPEGGYVKTYDNLIEMLKSYVATPDETSKKMEFHFNNKNVYSFEPEKFSNGAIWGLKEKRTKDEKGQKKTKSKLFPIASAKEFDEYVKSTGEIVIDKEKSKNRKKSVIHHVKIELCVLLLKECLLTQKALPGSRRDRHDSASTSTSPAKKSKVEAYFKFKATMLSIDFCSPIVTHEKTDNSVTTAPPSGSAKKYNVEFNLDPFIHHTTGDSNADETFTSEFSFPFFRFEMMKLAIKEFSDEYGVEKQALGPRVMFFILPNYITHYFQRIPKFTSQEP